MTEADDIWADDKLGRADDARFLEDFLIGRYEDRKRIGAKGSYVLNVNAEWGFGKTFFMTRLAEQLAQKYPVVQIDAWKNDFSDDPYTSVISEIEQFFKPKPEDTTAYKKAFDAVKKQAGKIFWLGVKGGMKRGAKWAIGEAVDEIVEVVDNHVVDTNGTGEKVGEGAETALIKVTDDIIDAFAKKRIDDFLEAKKSLTNFRESLGELLEAYAAIEGNELPLFVCIDELDRCRPPYAIAMLERIKHLFDVDDVVFLLSTDTKQLAHSISGVYGSTFDGQRYLQRFFTRTFTLPNPTPFQFIDAYVSASGVDEAKWNSVGVDNKSKEFLAETSHRFGAGLRDIEQAMEILVGLTSAWNEGFKIQLSIMYPLILGYIRGEDIANFSSEGWLFGNIAKFGNWKVDAIGVNSSGANQHEEIFVSSAVSSLLNVARDDTSVFREYVRGRIRQREAVDAIEFSKFQIINEEFNLSQNKAGYDWKKSIIVKYPNMIKQAGYLKS